VDLHIVSSCAEHTLDTQPRLDKLLFVEDNHEQGMLESKDLRRSELIGDDLHVIASSREILH